MPTTWLRDREQFISTMTLEGMALDDIRRVLRAAQKWRQGKVTSTNDVAIFLTGFEVLYAVHGGHTTIRKQAGTAWYRVPTRS